jgi:cell wall-associated NlpC family hydrolase
MDPAELEKRIQVVELAYSIKADGAHYLWGAQANGRVPMVTNRYSSSDPTGTCLYAASLSGDSTNVCAGRPWNKEVRNSGLKAWPALGDDPSLRGAAMADPTTRLWPRYYRDGDTANPSPSGLFSGESCRGKLHFDCAGFVRHCFRSILGAAIIPTNVGMRAQMQKVFDGSGSVSIRDADILPADVVFTRDGSHCGLAAGPRKYARGYWGDNTLHAWYAKIGVVETDIVGSSPDSPDWWYVYRWTKWG